MKLAEALIIRKDLQEEIDSLYYRINMNLIGQEGENPSEDPNILLKEYEKKQEELSVLRYKINKTNAVTFLDDNITLTQAISKINTLKSMSEHLNRFVHTASNTSSRYSKSEIRSVKYINIKDIQKKISKISKECRLLDIRLQEKNWQVDLV